MRFLFGARAVPNALSRDIDLAATKGDVALRRLDDQTAVEHEEEVIGVACSCHVSSNGAHVEIRVLDDAKAVAKRILHRCDLDALADVRDCRE